MTLVLGAMDGEVAAIVAGMDVDASGEWRGFPVVRGVISGTPVVVSRTGVGKSLSAMLCQHLIDEYAPERIIFTGVAGALRSDLEIGDTVIADDTMQHDMDVSALGFERGRIPYSPHRFFTCDPALVEAAMAVDPPHGSVHRGRILTGDQFIADPARREELASTFDGIAVEMEGASVGLVATVNEIPFLLIRTISDHSDGSAVEFEKVVAFAAESSWHYLCRILENL
ncbi:MAG TPA: 5'-methylthioadenosine/adenosylhomocysteine nucleosidase [Spirochaetia bacterium]|nr:5'-methylthioadenosine/adenosylhomocysteine nucleosidase [Spirochaetia bacterium]